MFLNNQKLGDVSKVAGNLFKELFKVSFISYFVLYFFETVQEGLVSYFIDLNIFLTIAILSGIIIIITGESSSEQEEKIPHTVRYYFISASFSLIAALIIFLQTKEIGTISVLLAALSGVLIMSVSYFYISTQQE